MTTVRAALAHALRQAVAHDPAHLAAPAAVLWPDPDRAWEHVIGQIQEAAPVLVIGEHDVDAARGPAIWARAVLACGDDGSGTPSVTLPPRLAAHDAKNPWIVYLPGFAREDLQSVTGPAHPLASLVELQYRAVWWHQGNGQPWTPQAFLRSRDGLGLDVAQDAETRAAVGEALADLLCRDVDELRLLGRLDAPRLRALLLPDPARELLAWIDDPEGTRARLGGEWTTFVSVCSGAFGFSPAKETPITAAGLLGRREGAWAHVWTRFTEAPARYPNLPTALDQAAPADSLFGGDDPHPDSWPARNSDQEAVLRSALVGLATADTTEAVRSRVVALHTEHRDRLGTVWNDLGRAPLARTLGHLAELVGASKSTAPAGIEAMAAWYATTGSRVDDLALKVIAEARTTDDRKAALSALGAIYDPWLESMARAFQAAAVPGYPGVTGLHVEPDTCVVFVDALRMDLGHRFIAASGRAGLTAALTHRLAAFPTVTPTGQPAVAPIVTTLGAGPDFCAGDDKGRAVTGPVLRKALTDAGVQFLPWGETGDATGVGWTQTNAIDEYGHTHDHKLADAVDTEISAIVDRVSTLLASGWRRVVVVTDHGWLLPARPARKVELPLHLTEDGARKRRVARLTAGHASEFPTIPWTWDPSVSMVSAPGTSAFEAGTLYEHGGLSPQECVIPVITVTAGAPSVVETHIEALKWTAMRCRIDIAPPLPGLVVELRLAAGDAASTIAGPRAFVDGEAKVLVEDDAHEGCDAHVVVLDDAGTVVAQRSTRVGENP